MGTFKGLIDTLEIRDDGWVEVIVDAIHSDNTKKTFYIKNLDGDITVAQKRLTQLCLLRDAVSRILPIEISYENDVEQGNLINDLILYPRPSIIERDFNTCVEGVVIGLSLTENGPDLSSTSYLDKPNLAGITLLQDDGTLLYLLLDIQRKAALTIQAMLSFLQKAYKTCRPVKIWLSSLVSNDSTDVTIKNSPEMLSSRANQPSGYIDACEWSIVPEATLDYQYAFIERLGQRYESHDITNTNAISYVKVVYTTSPAQTPEGDISDNDSFQPATQTGWLHCNSLLFPLLGTALKKRLQVKLGLIKDQIHEVEIVSQIGSAARPIWICINQSAKKHITDERRDNNPWMPLQKNTTLNNIKIDLVWKAQGYFNEGVWRFQVYQDISYELKVDGKLSCCGHTEEHCCCVKKTTNIFNHFYLKGIHTVELTLYGQNAAQPFSLLVYRIR